MSWNTCYSVSMREGGHGPYTDVVNSVSKHDLRMLVRAFPHVQWKVLCDEGWSVTGSTQDVIRRLANGPTQ